MLSKSCKRPSSGTQGRCGELRYQGQGLSGYRIKQRTVLDPSGRESPGNVGKILRIEVLDHTRRFGRDRLPHRRGLQSKLCKSPRRVHKLQRGKLVQTLCKMLYQRFEFRIVHDSLAFAALGDSMERRCNVDTTELIHVKSKQGQDSLGARCGQDLTVDP